MPNLQWPEFDQDGVTIWCYAPLEHKGTHAEKSSVVALGPLAQAILALAKAVAALQAEKDDHGWGSAEAHRAVILLARAVFGFKMALRSSL